MENKINVAELLKDCPKGMELDCTVFENLTFEEITDVNSRILCNIQGDNGKIGISFNKFGCYSELNQAKCVIFPKGKTTWKGFVPPIEFKDGDVIYNPGINAVAIFCKQTDNATISHCFLNVVKELKICHYHSKLLSDWRLASEEEKQKLFAAIKTNGYQWNPETKTLEKLPKFKVGDRIRSTIVNSGNIYTVLKIEALQYVVKKNNENDNCNIYFDEENNFELIPNKFDIGSLKPFESKVLVRSSKESLWKPAIFGYYLESACYPYYVLGGTCWNQCIPYEENEHLLGSTNDCDDYYKTWIKTN